MTNHVISIALAIGIVFGGVAACVLFTVLLSGALDRKR